MVNNVDSPYKGAHDPRRHFDVAAFSNQDQEIEIIDAYNLKQKYVEQRASVLKADGNTAERLDLHERAKRKTKALTTQSVKLKDYNKVVIYCPTCQGFGSTHRMLPHPLKVLLNNPEAYTELVGGLPLDDETIFLHCSYCNLRLIPSVDDADKLDARVEDEFEITSLADVRNKTLKPVIAGQTNRYNKARDKKETEFARRKRQVQEQLSTDYERQTSKGAKPSE